MRLLFIKLKHIGDALLLTPTLKAIRETHPHAVIWVVVRQGAEGILEGCPHIDRLLTASAPEKERRGLGDSWRQIEMARRLRQQRFDFAFELSDGDRGRWLAWLSGAAERVATRHYVRLNWSARRAITRFSSAPWTQGHRVEKDYQLVRECLPLPETPPGLVFVEERSRIPLCFPGWKRFAVMHPGTRWTRKQWPVAHWIEVGRSLQGRGLGVVVSAGPDAEERVLATTICEALGGDAISTDGQASWAELAGLLRKAALFIGVDTAAMHLAAACQCPTVAIFGPSIPGMWRPWKTPHRLVTAPESLAALQRPDFLEAVSATSAATAPLSEAIEACEEMLSAHPHPHPHPAIA
ncbi:MAG: glycosyltransferase family 9 protein [Verrucomicrobia bacterium]|nr:glycosyltransferase family 9 protein [Verrucomicrobiota bacterium]MBI3870679.1 glycosyltransferase family 9 protein [Verrucomicrobiota bacterium]